MQRGEVLSPAYYEAIEQGAAEQFDEVQKKVATERTKFFEQLGLLSGGAIVLSVSLLSTLFGKVVLHGVVILIAGWFALLVALLSCLYRTLQYQPYMMEVSIAHYLKMLATKKLALHESAKQGARVVSPIDEGGGVRTAEGLKQEADEVLSDIDWRKERAGKLLARVHFFEKIALHAFWLGILLLTVFAAVNVIKIVPLNTGPAAHLPSPQLGRFSDTAIFTLCKSFGDPISSAS
jgi:hypothetical protein